MDADISTTIQHDVLTIYNDMLQQFYKLFPTKKDSVELTDANKKKCVIICFETMRLSHNEQYFSLFIKRQAKFFKAIKSTLIPKFKMEVILNYDNETAIENKQIITHIWNNICLLYLLNESEQSTPNTKNMKIITYILENQNTPQPTEEELRRMPTLPVEQPSSDILPKLFEMLKNNNQMNKENLEEIFEKTGMPSEIKNVFNNVDLNNIDLTEMTNMLSKIDLPNIDISSISGILGDLNINNIDMSSITGMLGGMDLTKLMDFDFKNTLNSLQEGIDEQSTANGKQMVNDILHNIKTNFKLTEQDGKIDAKQFMEQIIGVGNTLGEEYSKKLINGELSITDILGALNSISTSDENIIGDVSDTLKLDKLNTTEVVNEFKELLRDKVPPGLMTTLDALDGDTLKNLNIGSLINNMMNTTETPTELTEEQKKKLIDFYENMSI